MPLVGTANQNTKFFVKTLTLSLKRLTSKRNINFSKPLKFLTFNSVSKSSKRSLFEIFKVLTFKSVNFLSWNAEVNEKFN